MIIILNDFALTAAVFTVAAAIIAAVSAVRRRISND